MVWGRTWIWPKSATYDIKFLEEHINGIIYNESVLQASKLTGTDENRDKIKYNLYEYVAKF